MNEETKAAIDHLKVRLGGEDLLALTRLFAWIQSEPARIAAAREEQREACALGLHPVAAAAVRDTPLTATPLADRIAELEMHLFDANGRADAAESRVAELEARLAEWVEKDGSSPGYNLEKAKTYGRIAGEGLQRIAELEGEVRATRYAKGRIAEVERDHEATIRRCEKAEAERDALRAELELRSEGWVRDLLAKAEGSRPNSQVLKLDRLAEVKP